MRLALICDWLTGMRGGEKCLEAVCDLYPQADIFCLRHDKGSVSPIIESHRITTSLIQRLPGDFRKYLPLFPLAIEQLDLQGYDLVISFSHCVAKGVRVSVGVPHICYCHTPVRYAWHMREQYLRTMGSAKRLFAGRIFNYLKRWDAASSSRVTRFIANSQNVRRRIMECYGRDADVIYPPVDCDRFNISGKDGGYYLVFSALVPYKRVDIAVEACNRLGRHLVIAGKGSELCHLRQIAGDTVEFVESPSDSQAKELLENCSALLFPGEEDFGMVPLEAQACGKPVIAFGRGGALETVLGLSTPDDTSKATGLFFEQQSQASLIEAISLCEQHRNKFSPQACRQNAQRFDRPLYKSQMQQLIEEVLMKP